MSIALLLLVGALSAIGPFSLDTYLPGLPSLAIDLGVTESQAQLTLTACMLGLAFGQMVAGPLSDSWGRKPPLIGGMVAFTGFSLACALAPNLPLLVAFRLLQGLGGAAGIVVARAMLRDRYAGDALVSVLTTVLILLGVAPIVAPIAGGWMLSVTDWRGVFVGLAGIGALLLTGCMFAPETRPRTPSDRSNSASIFTEFRAVITDPGFRLGASLNTMTSAAVFVYVGGSSFILQNIYGMSPQLFSVVFAANGALFVTFSQLNRLLIRQTTAERRIAMAIGLLTVGACSMSISAVLPSHPLWLTLIGFAGCTSSHGLAQPNSSAIALASHANRAGSAAALLGLCGFAAGALVAPLTGIAGPSVTPAAVILLTAASSAIVMLFRAARR